MLEQTPGHRPTRTRSVVVLVAIALLTAACTAATTIEFVAQTPAPATADSSDSIDSISTEAAAPTTEPAPDLSTNDPEVLDPPAQDDAGAPTAEAAQEQASAGNLPAGTTQVVLVDAGAEPRVELRLMIAASCGEIMTIEQTQEITQSLDGSALPGSGAVGTVVEMGMSAARNGGNYDVRSEVVAAYASPLTAPDIAATMNIELERLVGLATFVSMTDRGVQVPDSYRIEGAEALGSLQSAIESVAQVQSPLPIEPVGVGARWEITNVIDFGGAELVTVSEFLLINIDGTLIDMQVVATQTVEAGSQMDMQGFRVEVAGWVGTTTGETTLDMATISPIRSTSVTEAVQAFDFGTNGGLLEQEISSEITMRSEPDDGCTGRTIRP